MYNTCKLVINMIEKISGFSFVFRLAMPAEVKTEITKLGMRKGLNMDLNNNNFIQNINSLLKTSSTGNSAAVNKLFTKSYPKR